MLSPNHLYPFLSPKVMSDLTHVIDNHLLHEWAIRIEYTEDLKYLNTSWDGWGETFYKIDDSSDVIGTIFSCHANNPLCAIRLHAELYRPVSRFDFLICRAY